MSRIKRFTFAKGDKIEIIDDQHDYHGKKGTMVEITRTQLQRLIKPAEWDTVYIVRVKLDGWDKQIDFTNQPKSLETQIRKIEK